MGMRHAPRPRWYGVHCPAACQLAGAYMYINYHSYINYYLTYSAANRMMAAAVGHRHLELATSKFSRSDRNSKNSGERLNEHRSLGRFSHTRINRRRRAASRPRRYRADCRLYVEVDSVGSSSERSTSPCAPREWCLVH